MMPPLDSEPQPPASFDDEGGGGVPARAVGHGGEVASPIALGPGRGSSREPTPLGAGIVLGRYRVLRLLARGGRADVHLAELTDSGRLVALKCLHPDLARDPHVLRTFEREARLAEYLWHPNLVQVFDSGEVGGWHFITMEFVHGVDLRGFMRRTRATSRRTPIDLVVHIALGLCAALHHAHELRGPDGAPLRIVHRDLSPQNVMLTWEGVVRLLDFGTARSSLQNTQTEAGTFRGKVPYLSPEQCMGLPLDRRSDLFSLGALLYELTVGRRPFTGRSEYEVMEAICAGSAPPPREVDPNYDPDLEAIVLRAIEPAQDFRFQTARELGVALSSLLEDRGLRASAADLKEHVEEIFADRVNAWHRAQAAGHTLGEFLAQAAEESERTDSLGGVAAVVRTESGLVASGDAPLLVPARPLLPRPASPDVQRGHANGGSGMGHTPRVDTPPRPAQSVAAGSSVEVSFDEAPGSSFEEEEPLGDTPVASPAVAQRVAPAFVPPPPSPPRSPRQTPTRPRQTPTRPRQTPTRSRQTPTRSTLNRAPRRTVLLVAAGAAGLVAVALALWFGFAGTRRPHRPPVVAVEPRTLPSPPSALVADAPKQKAAPVAGAPDTAPPSAPVAGATKPEAAPVAGAPKPEAAPVAGATKPEAAPVAGAPKPEAAPVAGAPKPEAAPVAGAPKAAPPSAPAATPTVTPLSVPAPSPAPQAAPAPAPVPAKVPSALQAAVPGPAGEPSLVEILPSKQARGVRARPGKVRIRTQPVCEVVIDGRPRGRTPFSTDLVPGPHTLLLRNLPQNIERSQTVIIREKQSVHLRLDLRGK